MKQTSILDYKKAKEGNKTSVRVKKSNNGEEPKKVDKAPQGFVEFKKEGGKTYYKKVSMKPGGELKPAPKITPGSKGVNVDPKKYFDEMVEKVKSGIDPEELVRKNYIDPSIAVKLKGYFKPSTKEEIVYTEEIPITQPQPPKPKPITAYETEHMFDQNRHAIGAVLSNTRDSKDFAAQQGAVSPTGQDVWFAFYKPNTTEVDESKGLFKVPAGVWHNKISRGTNSLSDPALIEELQKYKYTPQSGTQKMATEVKQELPFQSTGSTLTSPRLR